MKRFLESLVPISIVFCLVFVFINYRSISKLKMVEVKNNTSSVFDRVIQTNRLKVGYLVLPPYLSKKTSSGELSGIFYDVMEELGRSLNLEIEWVEEVNLATMSIGLDNNRYDLIAFPLWRSSNRSKKVAFSVPLFYSTVGCYARADDTRFDDSLTPINSNQIRVSTIDGELAENIAKTDYPKAKHVALPPLSDYSQMLLQVSSNKADVTFHNRVFASRYIIQNPGRIKEVSQNPVRVFAECYILPKNDFQFQNMINSTILELIENGKVNQAFSKNGEDPLEYYMTAIPFRKPIDAN